MKQGFTPIIILALVLVPSILLAGCTSTTTQGGTATTVPVPSATAIPGTATQSSGNLTPEIMSVAAANNQFTRNLYLQLAGDPANNGRNIFFSPLSVSSVLALVYEGSRGNTADEIRSVFYFPTDTAALQHGYAGINAAVNAKNANYTLSTANALWAERNFTFQPAYIGTAAQFYSANATNLDFAGQPEPSRQIINEWVAEKTSNKILDLLPPGSIDTATRLVISNAVYFKGAWEMQFDKNDTTDADFHVSPDKAVTVKMMQRTGEDAEYAYTETANVQMLSLPYSHAGGEGLSMIVLLPKTTSLAPAEAALDPGNFTSLEKSASVQRVNVYIPKFKLGTRYDLSQTLIRMGMPTAFTGNADFSGMDGRKDLYVSAVIHKAYADVNEEGTEAAAATGAVMALTAMREQPPVPVFRADHPFIFVIRENNSGAVLFAGRVMNPAEE